MLMYTHAHVHTCSCTSLVHAHVHTCSCTYMLMYIHAHVHTCSCMHRWITRKILLCRIWYILFWKIKFKGIVNMISVFTDRGPCRFSKSKPCIRLSKFGLWKLMVWKGWQDFGPALGKFNYYRLWCWAHCPGPRATVAIRAAWLQYLEWGAGLRQHFM
jgi:hypothetical protein